MGKVAVQRDGPVTVVRLQNAARRNALDASMWASIHEAMDSIREEPGRAIVLVGDGDHFCSGMDLSPSNTLLHRLKPMVARSDSEGLRALISELKAALDSVATQTVPVVVAIEGTCLGSGLELALAGDIRVASHTAKFSLPETRLGMVPDVGGTVRLARTVGSTRAAEMILCGRTVFAETAEQWGLVNRVVHAGEALECAMNIANHIASMAPQATKEALSVLRLLHEDEKGFQAETEAGVQALLSGQAQEGFEAFREKRRARW